MGNRRPECGAGGAGSPHTAANVTTALNIQCCRPQSLISVWIYKINAKQMNSPHRARARTYMPPPHPLRHTTVCQRARLCLKLKDISVGDDRPHATEGLSGLRLATRFRYRSIADAQRMYRKPHRDGCRVVLKRASYLLLRVTPLERGRSNSERIRGVLRHQ